MTVRDVLKIVQSQENETIEEAIGDLKKENKKCEPETNI